MMSVNQVFLLAENYLFFLPTLTNILNNRVGSYCCAFSVRAGYCGFCVLVLGMKNHHRLVYI